MADASIAVMLTLRNEDSTLRGTITTDAGGRTKYGIAEVDNPDLWDANHPEGPTLEEAILRYTSQYWPLAFAQLNSQHVADFIFDLGVNIGKFHAAQIFQRAISWTGVTVTIDGVIGAETVHAANSCDDAELIPAILKEADAYYTLLATIKPEDSVYLKGWLARMQRDATQVDTGLTAE